MARHPLIGFEARQQAERCLRAVHHRHRDGAIERHDRAGRDALEEVIEPQDLLPVGPGRGGGLGVDGRDRGLDLIGPEALLPLLAGFYA